IVATERITTAENEANVEKGKRTNAEEARKLAEEKSDLTEQREKIATEQYAKQLADASANAQRDAEAKYGALYTSNDTVDQILSKIARTDDPFALALLVQGLVQRQKVTPPEATRALVNLTNVLKKTNDQAGRIVIALAIANLAPLLEPSAEVDSAILSLTNEAKNDP